jgi:hypothetical protein
MTGRTGCFRKQRGASLVEFAIVAIVFFPLVFGVFDFGRAILYYNMLSNAAREGARVGSILDRQMTAGTETVTEQMICTAVISHSQMPGIPSQTSYSCNTDYGPAPYAVKAIVEQRGQRRPPAGDGTPVIVRASYGFSPVTPLIGVLVGDPLVITASTSMRVED